MKYCIDLILGKAFCIFTFFHSRDSRFSVKVSIFNFDGVTLKTTNEPNYADTLKVSSGADEKS